MAKGFKNVSWFIGVVEDNLDPYRINRVRVRAFNYHSDDPVELPTEHLPWAVMISFEPDAQPPAQGDWVVGFFIDGEDAQHPFIFGRIHGVDSAAWDYMANRGFADPDMIAPNPCQPYEPSTPRLARAEHIQNSAVLVKEVTREREIPLADGTTWEEPAPAYNASYPMNRVLENEGGILEIDASPGSERVHIFHASGSYEEVNSAGNRVVKTTGDRYEINNRNRHVFVRGAENVTVSGAKNVYIQGNCTMKVDGNYSLDVHGDYTLNVGGKMATNVAQSAKLRAASLVSEAFVDGIDVTAAKAIKVHAKTDMHLKANGNYFGSSTGDYNILASGATYISGDGIDLFTSGNVNIDGDRVDLNNRGASEASPALPATITGLPEAIQFKQPVVQTFKERKAAMVFTERSAHDIDTEEA